MNFVKRLLVYLFGGLFFGLAWTGMFHLISGFAYIISFFVEVAIVGGAFGILIGLAIEISIKTHANKFKKIRLEIAQTSPILFDSNANHSIAGKLIQGWLFLTEENLLFKTSKPETQSREMVIPLNSIQRIDKYKFSLLKIVINNVLYEFSVSDCNRWVELINKRLVELYANSAFANRN